MNLYLFQLIKYFLYYASWFIEYTGEILVIDEDSEKVNSDISGYAIMDGNTTRYDLEE